MKLTIDQVKPGMKFKFTPQRIHEFRMSPAWGVAPGQVYAVSRVASSVVFHNHYGIENQECSSIVSSLDFLPKKQVIIIDS